MASIKLSDEHTLLVDDCDLLIAHAFNWVAHNHRKSVYAAASANGGKIRFRIHREIMHLAPDDPRVVDHINGNGLDNRRENLRICTQSENTINCRTKNKHGLSASLYRGVSYDKSRGRWVAEIHHNNKKHRLGRFTNELDAAQAYDEAAIKFHGDFAFLNLGAKNAA